ncbi:GMC family oxidoreductase [Phormidium tenue FACHB-886]|nr:GMC family oxidoreductase [Phormidium tenue FACHB-886]
MTDGHYDVIIIGTGAGGGTLTNRLVRSGKKFLVLERGTFLPKEKANWDSQQVFQKGRYRTPEVWYDRDNHPLHPNTHYYVGGNTKVYGGALFRLREQDFETVLHQGGTSPQWGLKYPDFAPYYTQAEQLYGVHGHRGLDPTEPHASEDYPFTAVPHEPYIQDISYALKDKGLHPFYLPLAIKLDEANPVGGSCIRCGTCDGFPCFRDAKADADINAVRPVMGYSNLTLIVEAKVVRLHTSASGREITQVEAEIAGKRCLFSADIVVIACGAVNSAALLLNSANDQHPAGLANRSNLVGRNLMLHQHAVVMTLTPTLNPTIFQKTLAVHDFYWGQKNFPFPMGSVQLLGNVTKDRIAPHKPPFVPTSLCDAVAKRSIAWLLTTEDLPAFHNRVRVQGGKILLDYTPNNQAAFHRLIQEWIKVLKSIARSKPMQASGFISRKMPLTEVAHQCGTCRFGEDPQTSVLDLNCRTHDVDNLYVVDGSFFPSSAAVNPSLTIMANALRVGDHLLQRLK